MDVQEQFWYEGSVSFPILFTTSLQPGLIEETLACEFSRHTWGYTYHSKDPWDLLAIMWSVKCISTHSVLIPLCHWIHSQTIGPKPGWVTVSIATRGLTWRHINLNNIPKGYVFICGPSENILWLIYKTDK